MKFYCGEFSDLGGGQGVAAYHCTGNLVSDAANLIFIDVSEPLYPSILKNVDLAGQYGGAIGGYGAVAAIREPAGTYLFATMKSPTEPLDFWRSTTTDLHDPAPWTLVWVGSWDPEDLEPTSDDWLDWQFINFVRDADGGLFLIGGKGGGGLFPEPISNGADWIRMFRVTEPTSGDFDLEWAGGDRASSERQLETEYPQMGNLDAAGAAYVSPTGQLIVYTAHHMRYIEDGTRYVAMGEFRNMDVHVSTTEPGLPPRLEVIDVDGDGDPETSCSGWIELYEDATGWDANGGPHRGEKFDYRDRYLRNWANPCYMNQGTDPNPIAFAWSMADEECAPVTGTGCTFSDPNAARPMVTCSSPGEYMVRLTVTDPLPLIDSQFPWLPPGSYDPTDTECAVLYVPEPGRLLMLGAGLLGLAWAGTRRARARSRGNLRVVYEDVIPPVAKAGST